MAQRAGHARHDGYFGLMDVGQPKAGETWWCRRSRRGGPDRGPAGQDQGLPRGGHCRRRRQVRLGGEGTGLRRLHRLQGRRLVHRAGRAEAALPQTASTSTSTTSAARSSTRADRINRKARIIICGAISQYNNTSAVQGPKNYLSLLVNRARMEGIVVFDYADRYHRGHRRDGGLPEGRPHEEPRRRGGGGWRTSRPPCSSCSTARTSASWCCRWPSSAAATGKASNKASVQLRNSRMNPLPG
jgi:hypothetical protein